MGIFRTCEYCGAHLDLGEPCDCREEEAAVGGRCPMAVATLYIDNQYNLKKEESTDVIGEEH